MTRPTVSTYRVNPLTARKREDLRKAFNAAGISGQSVEGFIGSCSSRLPLADGLAADYRTTHEACKALHASTRSKRALRNARRALDVALGSLNAVDPVPAFETPYLADAIGAIRQTQTLLDDFQERVANLASRPGKVPDRYEWLALHFIADLFARSGWPLVTTPRGLFPRVARILLKRTMDDDFSPRDLLSAIKAAKPAKG